MARRLGTALKCTNKNCADYGKLVPAAGRDLSGWRPNNYKPLPIGEELYGCESCGESMTPTKLSREQRAAVEAYEEANRQEDRYLGSVFVTRRGQEEIEAKTKAVYDRACRLGVGRWC